MFFFLTGWSSRKELNWSGTFGPNNAIPTVGWLFVERSAIIVRGIYWSLPPYKVHTKDCFHRTDCRPVQQHIQCRWSCQAHAHDNYFPRLLPTFLLFVSSPIALLYQSSLHIDWPYGRTFSNRFWLYRSRLIFIGISVLPLPSLFSETKPRHTHHPSILSRPLSMLQP